MAKAFAPKDFIRHTQPELLQAYCAQKQISFDVDLKQKSEAILDQILTLFESLDNDTSEQVESDFREINSLASYEANYTLVCEIAEQIDEETRDRRFTTAEGSPPRRWFLSSRLW